MTLINNTFVITINNDKSVTVSKGASSAPRLDEVIEFINNMVNELVGTDSDKADVEGIVITILSMMYKKDGDKLKLNAPILDGSIERFDDLVPEYKANFVETGLLHGEKAKKMEKKEEKDKKEIDLWSILIPAGVGVLALAGGYIWGRASAPKCGDSGSAGLKLLETLSSGNMSLLDSLGKDMIPHSPLNMFDLY
jgi:hypothetical protein